jgi:peptide deformylase
MTRMSLKKILLHPDPRLKKTCDTVGKIDAAMRKLADDMLETMYDAPGVGLAAPQVGTLTRLFVMDVAGKEADPEPRVLFNPHLTWLSDEMNTHEEGCLSIPEFYGDVTRPTSVRIAYQNIDGVEVEDEFDGLAATCAQHELDHLNGKLFIDYLSVVKRGMITSKMKKLKKERARDL